MKKILFEGHKLYQEGFAIIWLHPKSKRPIESGWTTGPRASWDYLNKTYKEGCNIGVRLGTPSKLGDYFLAVIDVDVKSTEERHKKEAIAAARRLLGEDVVCPTVLSGRGNGSRHYYCKTQVPFKTFNPAQSEEIIKVLIPSKKPSKKEIAELTEKEIADGVRLSHAWEISLYSDGRQVVLPPSIHPDTGREYEWGRAFVSGFSLPVCDFTGLEGYSDGTGINVSTNESVPKARQAGESGDTATHTKTKFEFKAEPVDLGWLGVTDKMRDAIVSGTGVKDRSGFLLQASSALFSAGLNQNEVLTVLTEPAYFLGACAYDHVQSKDRSRAAYWVYRYTVKRVGEERSAEGVFGLVSDMEPARKLSQEEMDEQALEFKEMRCWRQSLDKSRGGVTKETLRNLDLIFTNAVAGDVFKKDLFANRVAYGADTPWGGKRDSYIEDIDMVLVKRWFSDTEFGIEPNANAILEATTLVAHRLAVHPVRDWLSSLQWDGKPRISTWIRDFCEGEAEEPYLSEVSRKFLLAMVKRVFEPGCQWDYVLVLEGKQGKYKSSIARALASDKWFMDNLPDLKDKDAMLNLQGKWLIELGELTNVKRTDYNLVKTYLVRRYDTVRPHYGRIMADVPRQSVFIGTVNEGQYLKDPTGNRRYWPVKVGECDVKGLTEVRDQLFAEAYHVYKNENEMLMLGAEATKQATEAQEDRKVNDDASDMKDALLRFINSDASKDFEFHDFRSRDLMEGVNAPWGEWASQKYKSQLAAEVLHGMGFLQKKNDDRRFWRMPAEMVEKRRQKMEEKDAKISRDNTLNKRVPWSVPVSRDGGDLNFF